MFSISFSSDKLYAVHVKPQANDAISDLMNGPIREKLQIIPDNVQWGGNYEPL